MLHALLLVLLPVEVLALYAAVLRLHHHNNALMYEHRNTLLMHEHRMRINNEINELIK
jgi:hypothetical protein